MSILKLDWHLGLGDAIICNGLVRALAQQVDWLILPAYEHNRESVIHMFRDLDNVVTMDEARWSIQPGRVLSIGMNNPAWGTIRPFDRAFYHFAGVDFDARWDEFHIPESPETEIDPPEEPFGLIHHDVERKYVIEDKWSQGSLRMIWTRPITSRISDWRKVIRLAGEIHCIDSSMLHLVESLPTTGRLFFHQYARPAATSFDDVIKRKQWTVVAK